MTTKEEAIDLLSSSDELSDADEAPIAQKASATREQPAIELFPGARQQPIYNDEDFVDLTLSDDDEPDEGNSQEPGTRRGEKRKVVDAEEKILTYAERIAKQRCIKPKNNPWGTKSSRKRVYQARRKPVRDSKHIYHAKTTV
ncbi:hypothetical protein P3T76_005579 [Phytophthora citrophthora]|uniref:Uncharacterized protein n=1 Tax=Phytophthora citrophthora TaxID=4793 RepID=A0AAD9GQM2_9STRA|nr:hypothetical protein P3T76_005579 [Phytophthora citrophthora]